MEVFELDVNLIGTGQVFPQYIYSQDWIGYHGTSAYFCDAIESSGFEADKFLSDDSYQNFIELASRAKLDTSSIEQFRLMNSISFSPLSELCLLYTNPKTLGGQGIGSVLELVQQLEKTKIINLSSTERAFIKKIASDIRSLRSTEAVIYAVNLEGLSTLEYQTTTKSVYVRESVKPKRIVAKLKIGQFNKHTQINHQRLHQDIDKLFWGSGNHYIKRIK